MKRKSTAEHFRIVLAGGGTGGHIYPAIAIADELKTCYPKSQVIFIGTKDRLEAKIIPKEGYKLKTITVSYLPRKLNSKIFAFFPKLLKGIFQSIFFLRKFKPQIVIGTGGFVCGPVIIAAWLLKIPTAILEENVYPGITTKFLAKIVDEIYLVFAESKKYFALLIFPIVPSGF